MTSCLCVSISTATFCYIICNSQFIIMFRLWFLSLQNLTVVVQMMLVFWVFTQLLTYLLFYLLTYLLTNLLT